MRVWKKTLSMVLALSLALSLIVLPAGAAGGMTVSVSEATAKAGESFTLDLSVADNTAFQALTVYVYYPKDLTCSNVNAMGADWRAFAMANFGDGTITGDANPNDTTNNDRDDKNMASFGYVASTSNVPGFTNGTIGSLTFTSAADADSMDAEIEVVVVKASDANGDISANGSTSYVTIQGAPASIKSLTLEPAAVEVNGDDVTVTATALSTKDKPMSAALSVKPESDDVTVGNGKIIVDGKAKAGSYKVTAADDNGGKAEATLTVTRAPAVVTTVEITNGSTFTIPKTGTATLTFTAEVKDQFGDPIAADVTWNVTAPAGLTVDGNKVTVGSDATEGAKITATATAGGKSVTKTVKLVKIEIAVTPKANPSYGDTWAEILPATGVKASKDGASIDVSEVTRTIEGKNVDNVKPVPGEYTVTVTATTAEGPATTETTVTVGKLTIKPELDDQEIEYTGEAIKAKDVEYTVEKTGEKVVLNASNAEDCVDYDEDGYDVAYTLDAEKYPYYVLGEVKGGRLMITKVKVDSKDVQTDALEGLTLDEQFEIDKDGDKLSVRIPSGSYTLNQLLNVLKNATGDAVITVKDGKDTYRFTIESWVLDGEESDFDDEGVNVFLPGKLKGETKAAEEYLKNHAPALPTFTVRMTASSGGGGGVGGVGGGSAWDWGNRGNQTINLTPQSLFTDVPDGHTFQKDIVWVYYRGIMKGTSASTFSPASSTNRQQLWMVLGRISGSSPADMAMAREWAVNTGVSDGTKPTSSLTRQQMVTMLYRWAQSKGYVGVTTGSLAGYNDASSVAAYAKDAMTWAVGNGIINGSGNSLNPGGTATRGQFAAIMHRFCEKFGV